MSALWWVRRKVTLGAGALLLANAVATQLEAQQVSRARGGATPLIAQVQTSVRAGATVDLQREVLQERTRSSRPWVIGGALVGGGATAVALLAHGRQAKEDMTPMAAHAVLVVAGAGLGALGGWLLSRS